MGKRRLDKVAAWLGARTQLANGVTMREAMRYLLDEVRDRHMTADREKRPAD